MFLHKTEICVATAVCGVGLSKINTKVVVRALYKRL